MSEDIENITVKSDVSDARSSDIEMNNESSDGEDSESEAEVETSKSTDIVQDKTSNKFDRLVFKPGLNKNDDHDPQQKKVYWCEQCNLFFTIQTYYLRHIKFKHNVVVDLPAENDHVEKNENIKCNTCGKKFLSDNALKLHVLRIHQGVNCFKCKVCNAYFQQYTAFTNHMKFHDSEITFTCDICNYKSINKEIMELHKLKHDKEFTCRICCKVFTKLTRLQEHERNHKDIKNFYCDTCHRGFVRPSDLTIHRKIHSNEKPFQCETCLTRFRHRSALIVHIRQHTGERPYVCHICNKGYAQSGNLKMHLMKCKQTEPSGDSLTSVATTTSAATN